MMKKKKNKDKIQNRRVFFSMHHTPASHSIKRETSYWSKFQTSLLSAVVWVIDQTIENICIVYIWNLLEQCVR